MNTKETNKEEQLNGLLSGKFGTQRFYALQILVLEETKTVQIRKNRAKELIRSMRENGFNDDEIIQMVQSGVDDKYTQLQADIVTIYIMNEQDSK